jgi:hypothetical protein
LKNTLIIQVSLVGLSLVLLLVAVLVPQRRITVPTVIVLPVGEEQVELRTGAPTVEPSSDDSAAAAVATDAAAGAPNEADPTPLPSPTPNPPPDPQEESGESAAPEPEIPATPAGDVP